MGAVGVAQFAHGHRLGDLGDAHDPHGPCHGHHGLYGAHAMFRMAHAVAHMAWSMAWISYGPRRGFHMGLGVDRRWAMAGMRAMDSLARVSSPRTIAPTAPMAHKAPFLRHLCPIAEMEQK